VCEISESRFHGYTKKAFEFLKAQMLEKYGYAILSDDFDFETSPLKQPVTEKYRYWIEQFRLELKVRGVNAT
jgi:hypothetical protein